MFHLKPAVLGALCTSTDKLLDRNDYLVTDVSAKEETYKSLHIEWFVHKET